MKCELIRYLSQDDIVMKTLTVRENLAFSANVRLSDKISADVKKERVESVIQELGLVRCADTKASNSRRPTCAIVKKNVRYTKRIIPHCVYE